MNTVNIGSSSLICQSETLLVSWSSKKDKAVKSLQNDAFMCRRKALTSDSLLPNSYGLMIYLVTGSNVEDK